MPRPLTRSSVAAVLALGAALCTAASLSAQTAPSLGAASSFAVLGGSAVTNTGGTVISGDLGISPGTAITGFPPGTFATGGIQSAAASLAAQTAVTSAYNSLGSQACTSDLTGQDLGGLTLTPGVYCFSSSAQLTGTLTLNALGNPASVFIFKVGSSLTTASGSTVLVTNGGTPCNVFWQVGSSATLGTAASFSGNIIALTSITVTTGASLTGRALARNGAVTLDTSNVTNSCASVLPPVCPTIALAPPTLPNGRVALAYSQAFAASGGAAPYSFAVTAGTLPASLTLTSAGLLSGTPTVVASSSFTVRATDGASCTGSLAYTLLVAAAAPPVCPVITVTPAAPPAATVGVGYSQTFTGSGGLAPYVFTVTSGTPPAGLALSAAGVLAGTPTGSGTASLTIRATDANGCFTDLAVTLSVSTAACPVITVSPATPAGATVGIAYTQTFTGSGGAGPYVFSVLSGTPPPGLSLSAAGVLSGTPTGSGTSSLTIRATDANGCFADLPLSISVATPVPTMPQLFVLLLATGLAALGYTRLRRRTRARTR